MRSASVLSRVASVLGLLGVVHLLAPGRLLATAGTAYDRLLAVDFEPREGATRRVRLIGLLFVAVALAVGRGE
jgi:hypothetical protein